MSTTFPETLAHPHGLAMRFFFSSLTSITFADIQPLLSAMAGKFLASFHPFIHSTNLSIHHILDS